MKRYKHHGVKAIQLVTMFLATAVLFLWGWNSAIPSLFSLPEIQYREALGLTVLVGILSFFRRGVYQHACTCPPHQHSDAAMKE